MTDVTDKQQKRDPWTDPDPQPEDFEEWLADPENELITVKIPPNSGFIFPIPEGVTAEEWKRRKAAAHARGERLPEEIAEEEELAARRAAEEKDWTPEQKAAREAERLAAREALEKLHH
ncbi:MAG: hypothetical protein JST31_08985 [Actinobacteria bacterium]|nr:hypothetical protein [Actinomycetota bacterium]